MRKKHPYQDMPSYTRWSKAVAGLPRSEVNPDVNFPFKIEKSDRIATAGSCFAQHIARRLETIGGNYFVAEAAHPILSRELREKYNYGTFSARFGNIYTPRQLLQLMERAFLGKIYGPDYWNQGERYFDPLRPTIEPDGFSSLDELRVDRERHLKAVRKMFCELDYFVFTLGLTEGWISDTDGTIFPVCPGVAAGEFEPETHKLKNFTVFEVIEDMRRFFSMLKQHNPSARMILTVSPVPLVATAVDSHVLTSTTYSKAVLRVACDELVREYPDEIAYFPSFEIITGSFNRGSYFADDLRSVTDDGVAHVMSIFTKNILNASEESVHTASPSDVFTERMIEAQKVVCEEELIERALSSRENIE